MTDFGTNAFSHRAQAECTDVGGFSAPIGRGETRSALNLRIVLPAVKREDLCIAIEGGVLRLSGERYPPVGFSEDGRCHFAIPYGVFVQNVALPDGLDAARMQAHLHEGVLDVHIPYADVSPKAIAVAAGPVLPPLRAAVAMPIAV